MKNLFNKVALLTGAIFGGLSTSQAMVCAEFDGCADLLSRERSKQTPVGNLSEIQLEELTQKLFEQFEIYEETPGFLARKKILEDLKKVLQVLGDNNYLDSDIILLAGEIDSLICGRSEKE